MEGFEFSTIYIEETTIHLCNYQDFNPLSYQEFLTRSENERLISFKSVTRRQEFVATRLLRHNLFGFEHIHYDDHGAPYIDDEGYISISHCNACVGIAINKDYKIGLDLESPRTNILSLKHKFLSEHEQRTFDVNDSMTVAKIWSAKEALYKLAGRKKIHFKSELLLDKGTDTHWKGHIVNPDCDVFVKLNIFEHEGKIISINTEPIVEQSRNI